MTPALLIAIAQLCQVSPTPRGMLACQKNYLECIATQAPKLTGEAKRMPHEAFLASILAGCVKAADIVEAKK